MKPLPAGPLLIRRQQGMALIEVLVSILVFAFGALGLLGLEARVIDYSVDAEDRNRAALLADNIASSMWLAGSATVSTAAQTAWQTQVSNTAAGGVPNGIVTFTTVTANSTDIKLTWKAPSRLVTDASSVLTTRVILP